MKITIEFKDINEYLEFNKKLEVKEEINKKEARQLLWDRFKQFASFNEISESEFKNMLDIYFILFPDHP